MENISCEMTCVGVAVWQQRKPAVAYLPSPALSKYGVAAAGMESGGIEEVTGNMAEKKRRGW
jgi:hypothetical protein